MATLQAGRAKAVGLTTDEAKSFGLNRAIFYAAAKRGFKGGSTKKQGKKVSIKFSPLHREEKTLDLESDLPAEWGVSEANQKAKYYQLTAAGKAQLSREQSRWSQLVHAIGRIMNARPTED